MPNSNPGVEIEIKLRVQEKDALRARLKRIRAREISPRTFESNTLYDTPLQDLRRRGRLIRVRIERTTASSAKKHPFESLKAVLTYKGPAPRVRGGSTVAKNRAKKGSHFKIKDEAEVSVTNPDNLARILHGLGLRPSFRYEKFRTTYALPAVPGLKVELDETPVGTYLELEGPVAAIDRAARLLGYTRENYLTDTYGSLYLADCRKKGCKPGDMLFPPTK